MENCKSLVDCPLCGGHDPTCHWCDDDGKVIEISMSVSDTPAKPEHVSLQVVDFTCGVCHAKYQVELREGDLMMVACPHCENASLQMVRGTA